MTVQLIGFFTLWFFSGAVGGFCGYFYGMWSWQQWVLFYSLLYSVYCIGYGIAIVKGEIK